MPRCDGCKHWKLDEHDWEASAVGFGECKGVRERWAITDEAVKGLEYGEGGYEEKSKAALAAAKAYVQDGSEYHAELLTAPDFFCALHDPKI